jgi:cholesterol transport system auxiliary component
MRLLAAAIVLFASSGCSLMGSKDPPKANFDFGPPPAASGARYASNYSGVSIVVYEVAAPAWMDSSSMYYRLAYQNAASPMPYAQSEWVMSPAALLTQRLRSSLSDSSLGELRSVASDDPAVYALRSELFEFEQVFDQPGRSRGVLRLRATLEGQGMWARRTFVIEKPAPTADATGGVTALSQCADELAVLINQWVVANPPGVRDTADPETHGGRFRAASSGRAQH